MSPIHAYAAKDPKGSLQPFDFDPGELGQDQVEIKVSHCGICHSDLSMLDNEWGMSQFPFVPGHEAVGTVIALGENVTSLKVGQRVGIGWAAYSCLSCRECLSGHPFLLPQIDSLRISSHSALPPITVCFGTFKD
jgi:alcohol/geraniol dehydrogenase (NADP+)